MSGKLDVNRLRKLRDDLQTATVQSRRSDPRERDRSHGDVRHLGRRADRDADPDGRTARAGITDVCVTSSGCAGLCSREPMATVQLQDEAPVRYVDLDADKIGRILEEHVIGGKVVQEYALAMGNERVGT